VISEAPPFWWTVADWRAHALSPLSAVYGLVAARRMDTAEPERVPVPVVCVGNFTVGGAGKTPASLALARAALAAGRRPGFLSRGHGGLLDKPRLVDPAHDQAQGVGDEPLLLSAVAPTAVGVDRRAGAGLLVDAGCDLLIMDDGFQSRRLRWDLALVLVDAAHGIGNGHVIPGGPLRAPLGVQIRHADAVIVVGDGTAAARVIRRVARAGKPVHFAGLRPVDGGALAGRRVLAFSGIGHPQKFFDMVTAAGAELSATRPFPDHHAFSAEECDELVAEAERAGLCLVTTAKDAVRLAHGQASQRALAAASTVFSVEFVFEPEDLAATFIAEAIRRHRDWR